MTFLKAITNGIRQSVEHNKTVNYPYIGYNETVVHEVACSIFKQLIQTPKFSGIDLDQYLVDCGFPQRD